MKKKEILKNILGQIFEYKLIMLGVFISSFLSALTDIVNPRLLGNITDIAVNDIKNSGQIDLRKLLFPIGLVVLTYLGTGIFDYLSYRCIIILARNFVRNLRRQVSEKIGKISISTFDKYRKGDLLSRLTNDIETLGQNVEMFAGYAINAILMLVGVAIMMIYTSAFLSLIYFLGFPFLYLTVKFITSKSQAFFKRKSKETGDMVSFIEESFSGADIIKAYGYEEEALEEFKAHNKKLYESSYKASFMAGIMQPLSVFISNLSYVAICLAGGLQVLKGNLRVGDVQAMLQYIRKFSWPLDALVEMSSSIQGGLAAAERIYKFLGEEEEEIRTDKIQAPIKTIDFEHLLFAYEDGKPVIKDLNLNVKKGQTLAIVGPTGAGKTTLVSILMAFYDSKKGSIKINGKDIKSIDRENLRSYFAMVLQDTWIFEGSIYENIAYSKTNATREEVIEAAKRSYCHSFIETLPKGYDSILKENGSNISKGQRQLITIARAFLKDPEILILDEATSSVDTRTEKLIQKAMGKLTKDRTGFIIAHRLSTIRDADNILVLENGDIVEKGNHEELIRKNGIYKKLFDAQFANEV
ncbi:ABC transporter ATP-binding protein/permease [Peptoniphilus sp. GNH]|nr:ABC transporter ATP-binding protein/permease [Peptoniphilus sp. GNH]